MPSATRATGPKCCPSPGGKSFCSFLEEVARHLGGGGGAGVGRKRGGVAQLTDDREAGRPSRQDGFLIPTAVSRKWSMRLRALQGLLVLWLGPDFALLFP